jgi:putative sigma-54 modulation protein
MQVTVSSRHADVSEALRATAVEKIGRLERFLEGMIYAEVHFDQHRNPRIADREICEVTLEGQGHVVRCKVAATDSFAAVDAAVDKLEQQLTRLKSKLKGKAAAARRRAKPATNGVVAVAEPDDDDPDHSMADDGYVTRAGELVVKKKSFAIAPITVDDAVLQMDLVGHDFYFFTNAATGKAAVLYRREDGNLGLIDQS